MTLGICVRQGGGKEEVKMKSKWEGDNLLFLQKE